MSAQKVNSSDSNLPRGDVDGTKTPYSVENPETELDPSLEPAHVVDHHAERALFRKFDFRLLPVLTLMYLFNALDKGNLGNAKTDGMEKDLRFKNNDYNIILSVFYVPYVLFAPPIVSQTNSGLCS
jgi:hypothetical protein